MVRAGSHSMADAIAEARGQVTPTDPPSGMQTDNQPIDERISDQVIRLLEAATTAQQALGDLHVLLGGQDLKKLPDAWRGYAEEALGIIRSL